MSDPAFDAPDHAPPGSPPWYGLLFTPADRREAVAALLDLRAAIVAAVRRPSEPAVARARLEWWRAEVSGFGAGREQHPTTRMLARSVPEGVIQPEYLLELVDGTESELAEVPCRNYSELALYCYRTGGVLHEMIVGILGLEKQENERAARRYAQRLGGGIQLVEIIAGLRADLGAGRHLLPRDWLIETGAEPHVAADGTIDPATRACLDRLAGEARLALDEASGCLPAAERPRQRPGLVLAALYRRQLGKLYADDFNPRALPGNLGNLWTAWRAARQAHRAKD